MKFFSSDFINEEENVDWSLLIKRKKKLLSNRNSLYIEIFMFRVEMCMHRRSEKDLAVLVERKLYIVQGSC